MSEKTWWEKVKDGIKNWFLKRSAERAGVSLVTAVKSVVSPASSPEETPRSTGSELIPRPQTQPAQPSADPGKVAMTVFDSLGKVADLAKQGISIYKSLAGNSQTSTEQSSSSDASSDESASESE